MFVYRQEVVDRFSEQAINGLMGVHRPDQLHIRWTLSSPDQVQIARPESGAALDEFIGPKL
jgi:hypothetical protein